MNAQRPIRTALLGFGLAGSVFHAPAMAANPRYLVEFIVTANPARVEQARRQFPRARILPSPEEFFRSVSSVRAPGMVDAGADVPGENEVELVIVATPPGTHAMLTRASLEAGFAVVVDKPFTVTSAEGRDLVELARQRGLPLTVYQNRRWDGEFLTLRTLLARNALGRVQRYESRLERWQPDIVKAWKAAATERDGGGVLYDLGSHLIDQALQLFGPAVHVYGELDVRRRQEKTDDDGFVALLHDGGVRSHLWMNLSSAQRGPRLRVLGSSGAYTKLTGDQQEAALAAGVLPGDPAYGVDPRANWGLLGKDGQLEAVPTERGEFPRFYDLLATALREGGPLPVDPADALAVTDIIEKVREQNA
ncbi:Gfo/Idh/MocA family oxidoreductase [Paenarthrobacter sp. Z7-10]|uniref:Gfo/Idh/MocA family protein n=1 Tax=Paenarthrobacter sp. Z7-10 TaxID=2787635 RepID=UPI0022A8FED3|nr:Gfo/Idh/MocA family oxidoreductase [Paenarthrobacter sp. Z7-10]MCZ2401656.1 Gfo/Idh/MocA family oxidoreductase [Paenarthrobacter sp. Z7-10]